MAARSKKALREANSGPAWPADAVERRPIGGLIPYARNARTHSDAQVAQIAASMREWGWTNPILVGEDGGIIAGHGRVLAARRLGITEAPVMVARGWTEAQRRAYVLADNKLALNAGWDEDILRLELDDLRDAGVDLGLMGFTVGELGALFGENAKEPTNDIPPMPASPVSITGDIWILGRHRLTCGSCVDRLAVEATLAGAKVDVCLTDPPYGIGDTVSAKNEYDIHVDTRDNLVRLVAEFIPIARRIAPVVVLTPSNGAAALYPAPTWTMAWFTPAGVGRGPWGFCCWQPILCYGKDPKLAKRRGSMPDALIDPEMNADEALASYRDAIVHTESSDRALRHPCAKPVHFWTWLLKRISEPGEVVFEPFSGAGTTIVAAEAAMRTCCAIELSPAYVDVAVMRWQAFTGEQAKLESDGRTFDEIKAGK